MRCLFVLGMHRSGTSFVAQSLHAAGISAGPVPELLSAQSDNPEGFFENRRLVEINDALISTDGGSWFAPPLRIQADSASAQAQTTLLEHLADSSPSGQFFVKDPRLCLTWPLWEPLAQSSSLMFVYRSPLAVAQSLARRNGFPLQLGLLLWEIYNRRAIASLPGDSLALNYDDVSADGVSLLPVIERLRERGFDCASEKAGSQYRADLRHFSVESGDNDWQLLSDSQKKLHDHCVKVCENGYCEVPLVDLDPESQVLARIHDVAAALAPLARVVETGQERDAAQTLADERLTERDRALSALSTLEGEYDALVSAHEAEQRVHAQAAETLAQLQKEHDALASAHDKERQLHLRAGQALEEITREHDALFKAHEAEKVTHAAAVRVLDELRLEHDALARAHENEVKAHASLIDDHTELVSLHTSLHEELDERTAKLASALNDIEALRAVFTQTRERLESENQSLEDKTEYLFSLLTDSHRTLLSFEQSTMARFQRYTRKLYRLFTGQRGRNSAYEDLLEQAHRHFDEFALEKPGPRPTKLRMAGDVIRYVRQNPAGSARSFSLPRLRRAASVFFGSSSDDLAVWVNARFPDAATSPPAFDPASLSEDLDALELDFPEPAAPRVSIIVPVYNDYRVTINCLQSVHRFSQDLDYEVIIADDCSTDLTTTITERMRGITVSRTTENLRFLKNCNQAVAQARGEFLVFLNNDTAVTEGWLATLIEPFNDQSVGVTGPKLLFADGVLQEAGGIIWNDASGWNFGRADDPDKPAFNYRRDVDYVSGACLAIRGDLWQQLGGFDERFAPAYYEDADICFAARAAGFRVVYQPESVIYHFEGVSNGTDLNAGVKQHQVTNQVVFREKWQGELDEGHFPNAQHVIHARDRSAKKPCILVIDHYVPHHDKDAGGRSTYMYLQLLLSLGCRVQLMGANFFPHQPYTKALQAMGVEVLVGESVARHLDEWLSEHAPYIDEIFLHRPHIAEQMLPYLERLSPRPPISFFGHDLHYLRIAREAALKDDDALRRESESWRKRELAVCERVDRVYYFSDVEIEALSSMVPAAKLRRIPLYAMELDELPPYEPTAPRELLFVGGYNHPPNVDAARWLVEEIFPAVLASVPDARLHLVGSNPPTEVLTLASDNVCVHGYVSDAKLDALYRQVGAVVVPLRYGAGIKGKIIEAIANHVPVVTTDIGVEGIPESDTVMWIENTAGSIADTLVSLLLDHEPKADKLDRHEAWLHSYFDRESAASVLRADIPDLAATESPAQ
ncbi:glycosyltransferase [Congregibacter litoralis]|uniref:Putative glycosyltransferase n=1 Tax=Congregibacter litoralis KT71 TaxID=314285 RepID=A4AE68_9GAMM|nr:glycosyltransferase [Congregibacter litoralis]EAQ95713.2 putative glycosyltransferase [Congregibacter litoralis KT71]